MKLNRKHILNTPHNRKHYLRLAKAITPRITDNLCNRIFYDNRVTDIHEIYSIVPVDHGTAHYSFRIVGGSSKTYPPVAR